MQTFHFREVGQSSDHIGQYNFIGDAQDGHDWFKLAAQKGDALREGPSDAHEFFVAADDFLI